MNYVRAVQSEWLKTKRSLGSWLVVTGALFTPTIVTVAHLYNHANLSPLYARGDFWTTLWHSSWESMAIFFLPMAVILITSLITQIEFKNNAWKQVHTLPLRTTTIFFAKLTVIVALMLQFLFLFNVGIYFSAVIPCLLIPGLHYPGAPLPISTFLSENGLYFLDSLPILAAQFMLSLRFKNFLVPVGVGFLSWVGALAALSWRNGYWLPYIYGMLNYLKDGTAGKAAIPPVNFHLFALGYFVLFTLVGYCLFLTNPEKG